MPSRAMSVPGSAVAASAATLSYRRIALVG